MGLSGPLAERIREHLSRFTGKYTEVERHAPVGGGSINDCFRIDSTAGRFFVKVNTADRHPGLYEAEADGLRRLMETGAIRVPRVIAHGEEQDEAYLLLEWVEQGLMDEAYWTFFGRQLAELHRSTDEQFGLDRDNYIGSLKQVNDRRDSWSAFLIDCRLEPLVRMARDRGRLDAADAFRFERLFMKLHAAFPSEPPALLHGDLWSGNRLCATNGEPVLVDPAVYYGHREMDLGMATLFGGFEAGFFKSYHDHWPLEPGWQERAPLTHLYPLLVHAVLFGGGYPGQVRTVLKRYA